MNSDELKGVLEETYVFLIGIRCLLAKSKSEHVRKKYFSLSTLRHFSTKLRNLIAISIYL